MILYGNLNSGNCYKVRLLLSYLGVAYTYENMDAPNGATRTPEFLAINPAGQIPVLVLNDGRTLAESNAIMTFLAEDTPYVPVNAFDRAKALQWMFWEQYKHEPAIAVARFISYYAPDREGELPNLHERGRAALDVMEGHLQASPWFAGSGPSVADIALYAYTHVAEDGGFKLADYPHVQAWCERMAEHPKHVLMTDMPA
ncbi:MAG: glutathione S-transferase family protein [Litorimonas sp.]